MKIAIIAPPFICVPPRQYGGTELFIANLAEGLKRNNVEVVVYTNGESTVNVDRRWFYERAQWPIQGEIYDNLKDINHTAWSVADAARDCDLIHLNNLPGLAHSRFVRQPFVYTVHHPQQAGLSEFYESFPQVQYITISHFQRRRERMPRIRTIHHGIDGSAYRLQPKKQGYLAFLGRIAPIKGTHIAIAVAKRVGIPLKIAGEIQPIYRPYYDSEIRPQVDGRFIEYVGEVGLAGKNELLGNALALLFPIEWDEPFGLVLIEAMACGTPILAFGAGSVSEIVQHGVSGYICKDADDMASKATSLALPATTVRAWFEAHFTLDRMVEQYMEAYAQVLAGGDRKAIEPGQGETAAPFDSNRAIA
ncbi:MAG: glycosyltransferase family 4 protein [Acidobacteria bacterium]|nr:glycosyltransferase family 4 protein [Acidobacteriota bacterium]